MSDAIKWEAGEVVWIPVAARTNLGWLCPQSHHIDVVVARNGVQQGCPSCQELAELRNIYSLARALIAAECSDACDVDPHDCFMELEAALENFKEGGPDAS